MIKWKTVTSAGGKGLGLCFLTLQLYALQKQRDGFVPVP